MIHQETFNAFVDGIKKYIQFMIRIIIFGLNQ